MPRCTGLPSLFETLMIMGSSVTPQNLLSIHPSSAHPIFAPDESGIAPGSDEAV
jgi:hypothetical protein